MQKLDLKDGMVVELRKGARFMYINNYLYNEIHEYNISHYNNDLIHYQDIKILDIVKVYRVDVANIKNIFKLIKLGDLLTDKYLKLIWERKEIDWSKVPFGTKVICWDDNKRNAKEGKFLAYKNNTYYPFRVYIDFKDYDEEVSWKNCELVEELKEEREFTIEEIQRHYRYHCEKVGCDKCNYNSDDESCWTIFIAQNYNVTRK